MIFILILKPGTYMNESGRSVAEAMRFFKIPLGDVTVFYDEIDLRHGVVKAEGVDGGPEAGYSNSKSLLSAVRTATTFRDNSSKDFRARDIMVLLRVY